MATDPSIPLSVRPPQIDDPAQKILTLRGLAQQQDDRAQEHQVRALQIQQGQLKLASDQRDAAAVQATSAAMKNHLVVNPTTGLHEPDYDAVAKDLYDAGFAEQAAAISTAAMKSQESRLTYQKNLEALQESGRQHLGELALSAQRAMAGGTAPPNVVKTNLIAHVAVAAGDGLISEQDAHQFIAQAAAAPPEALTKIFDQFLTPQIRDRESKISKETAETKKIEEEASGTLPETPAQKSTRLLAEAHLRLAQRADARAEKAADPFGLNGQGGAAGAAATAGAHGDEFLKTLPPQIAGEVKAYAEGKRPFPTGMSYAKLQPLIAMVGQYDPTFDAINFNARNKARTDLTSPSGTGGKTINALNTAIQHAGKLSELIESLDNIDSDPTHILGVQNANAIKNWWNTRSGSTKVTNFTAVAPQLAKEIERAWRGAGGSVAEIKELEESIGKNLSRQQQREALYNFVELAKGKLDSTETQRNNALGPVASKDVPILFDQNKKVIDTITQRASGRSSGQSMRREVPGHPGQFAVSSDGGKTWTAE